MISFAIRCAAAFFLTFAPLTGSAAAPDAVPAERSLSFRQLGLQESAEIRGIDGDLRLSIGMRRDELVTRARLVLRYTWSPALIPALSHLKLSMNGVVIGTAPLPRNETGATTTASFDLDPRYFTDYNQLRIQLIGHYTNECEDPAHTSLWAAIDAESALELSILRLNLANDLALFPEPFFDRRDSRRLELSFVLGEKADIATLRAASVMASWLGALADYRGARFSARIDQLPQSRHGIVFATNAVRPAGLKLDEVTLPTLTIVDNPAAPGLKLLIIQGRDSAQLSEAVEALVLGQVVLGGPQAQVHALQPAPRRAAYDAPRWVPTDRPVRFGELVDDSSQLQVKGLNAPPIRLNLRVPPDLMPWRKQGVPLDLRYRYTTPVEQDNSLLSIGINDEFITSFRLRPRGQQAQVEELILPLLDGDPGSSTGDVLIPAFQVGADNQLQFRFALDTFKSGPCQGTANNLAQAALDPDSTIDLSGFPHYTAMPNLSLFANAGYPFTKYADLAETLVVLPDAPDARDIEDLLFLMGRMGRQTGAAATRVQLTSASALPPKPDADLLVIDGRRGRDLLQEWSAQLPVSLDQQRRELKPRPPARWYESLVPAKTDVTSAAVDVSASGPMAALLALESPLHKGRSVVVLTATVPEATALAHDVLEDGGLVRQVRGDSVLIKGREVSSYRGERSYFVGELPWWMAAWMFIARYPLLLVLFTLVAGLLIAAMIHSSLRRRAERRLAGE
jgi:cellulose synthase operon protein B